MDPGDAASRRDVRTVEIGAAVLVGALLIAVPNAVLWIVEGILRIGGPGWAAANQAFFTATIVVATAVVIWRLVRARRRGI